MPRRLLVLLSLLVLGLNLTSCGGSDRRAHLRILNVSRGYASLDFYTNTGDSGASDVEQAQSIGFESASAYSSVDSGTYTVKFTVHAVSDSLQSLNGEKFADDSHATYIAYGANGNFASLRINEDLGDPDDGKAVVQLYNTAEAGALDVYLTTASDTSTSLANASPTFSNVAYAAGGAAVTIDHGSYRLRVTAAGDKNDLRLDVASLTFDNKQNSSVILSATSGGALVNAFFLPQQGSLSTYKNTQARVRAAVGISVGTSVTVGVGGRTLLTNAPLGVINNTYQQVAAGSATTTLSVDSNAVSVPDQTLTAGGDYTLLIWSNADGTESTLVTDDNHLPISSGKSKLRLLNGLSGLGGAATLTANFSPVAEAVPVGQASTPAEIDSGTDYELDVSDASNGSTLLSKTSITLTASDVYTMFVAGGGTSSVTGVLHKDR